MIGKMRKKSAFTLSETLIALVIIGVVAALTIPGMLHKYQDMERAAKIRKTYSTLANALTFVIAEGGTIYFDNPADDQTTMNNWYDDYLKHHLSVMQVCKGNIEQIKECWEKPTCLNGGCSSYGTGNAMVAALLVDGTSFMADRWTPSTFGITSRYDKSNTGMVFYFDINGKKKPNKIGEDVYIAVFVSQEGFIPAYRDKSQAEVDKECSSKGMGLSCIRQYLKNEK